MPIRLFLKEKGTAQLFFITLVTAVYLVFELSFNATLLDVVGSNSSPDEVDRIQMYGRLLSGFALALALWPAFFKRFEGFSNTVFGTLIATAIIMSAVYAGEKKLVDDYVKRSTPLERYVALHLTALQYLLVTEDLEIEGLQLGHEEIGEPDGRAFLAVFPLAASTIGDVHKRIAREKPSIVRRLVDHRYGGRQKAYANYLDSEKQMRGLYREKYTAAVRKHHASLDRIDEKQNGAWNEYTDQLRKRNINPDDIPENLYDSIRKEVRKKGVPVPDDWDPHDRDVFEAAMEMKMERTREKMDAGFSAIAKKRYGISAPPGLTLAQFLMWRDVQRKWREALQMPRQVTLTPGMSMHQFGKMVYEPVLDIRQSEALDMYNTDEKEFGIGGKYYNEGKARMKFMVVPPIALCFSLAGLFIHIFKTFAFLTQIITGYNLKRKIVLAVIFVILSFLVFNIIPLSKITRQDLFNRHLMPSIENSGAPAAAYPFAYAIRGTIHMQRVMWPVSAVVRDKTGLFKHEDTENAVKTENLSRIRVDLVSK